MVVPNVEQLPGTAPEFTPNDLLRPEAFPHATADVRSRETNLSWVILTGPYAYKIKKPVSLGFVDHSTLEQRKALCDEELRLNARMAGDLYEAVVPITWTPVGPAVGSTGVIIDYAIRMKQFEASQELSALLDRGRVDAAEIRDLGSRLADFHRLLPKADSTTDFECTQALHDAVLGSLATLLCHLSPDFASLELGALVDWIHDFLHDSLLFLCNRERDGHVRECHGDLHARNIVRWHGQLVPFDSLEFDPKLRWIDTMNDVAFLFMDLLSHKRTDLAFDFLNAYLSRTGDYHGVRLLRFYAVYRALVRAMVDSLAAENTPASHESYLQRTRIRLATATELLKAPAPVLIITHGLSGSGKSWVSARLAEQLGAVLVRSDVERKRFQEGTDGKALHSMEFDQRTYAQVLACAKSCIQGGITVIADATFLDAVNRDHFRSWAASQGVPFVIVSCRADLAVLETRVQRRQQSGNDPSDADLLELRRQIARFVPPSLQEKPYMVEIDTVSDKALPVAFDQVRALIAISRCRMVRNIATPESVS